MSKYDEATLAYEKPNTYRADAAVLAELAAVNGYLHEILQMRPTDREPHLRSLEGRVGKLIGALKPL